ncbi:MAG: IS30 family transposase [Gammaproteobacteria bacterium]|nr:IS30 family transposase [Gammaproteobacteria bacterium]
MSYTHITSEERYVIYHLKLYGVSLRKIGRRLHRHHTSIGRELKRNRRLIGPYWSDYAHELALQRRHQARHYHKRSIRRLYHAVLRYLQEDWSPALIAGYLKRRYPGKPALRISPEGIYRWIYADTQQGGRLSTHLRRQHKKRRKQRRYAAGRGLILDRVSLSQRPQVVDRRQRFGDWEGDTLEGAKGTGGIATHVERKSRFLVAAKLADKRAETMTTQTGKAFHRIPQHYRKTLTVDNGKEFAEFKRLEQQTGFKVYFADPYSAWQRGTNENTNGLLRQYFPKGTDFSHVTAQALAVIVKKLNNRPRKCLNYRTPREVFF